MKKIIILVLALMLCMALCAPVFADNARTVLTPTKNSDGNDEIRVNNPGNYFITKDCELSKLIAMNCTLTIAKDVKVTVTSSNNFSGSVLNIESGAVLSFCGYGCSVDGTINVYGAVNVDSNIFANNGTTNVYGTVYVDSETFSNTGTLNVHGTVDISKCDTCTNVRSGTINLYTDGSINGFDKISNLGTINKDLACNGDHNVCDHAFGDDYICTKCGYVNTELHTHDFTAGYTVGCCKCGEACPHENTAMICNDCNMEIDNAAPPTASTLSEGNMTIVVGAACLALGLVGGLLIGKKKKPTAAEE